MNKLKGVTVSYTDLNFVSADVIQVSSERFGHELHVSLLLIQLLLHLSQAQKLLCKLKKDIESDQQKPCLLFDTLIIFLTTLR